MGISEGWLLGIPWQVLPLSRSVVKEWLVFAGIDHSVFRAGVLDSGQRWVNGAVGSLASLQQGKASLLQEFVVLSSYFPAVVSLGRASDISASIPFNLFARLSISSEATRMAQGGEWADTKKNLRRLYELLAINIVDTKEMSMEVKKMADSVSYTSQQISNNDARIDDNESRLREIHGQVDRIQEDLQRFMEMHQASRINGEANVEVAEAVLPMEEESVVQPRNNRSHQ